MSVHPYTPDAQSGAGNCTCGAAERHVRHPHEFVRAANSFPQGSATVCVCSLPFSDALHKGGTK